MGHLESIRTVTDANRGAFGFNPIGAYKDAISKGKLWVAADADGQYLGHIMFGGKPFQELRIFQIYVDETCRGAGTAKLLIDTLAAHGEQLNYLNLRADVASDLTAAVAFWQSIGFCALAPRRKKNATGREVRIFYKRLSTPTLLPDHEDHSLSIAAIHRRHEANSYVMDLNIFLALIKKRSDEQLIAQIIQAALAGEFSLFVTPEFQEELRRNKRASDPIFALAETALPVLDRVDASALADLLEDLRKLVFPDRTKNRKGAVQDSSDLRHLAYCILNERSGFITNENALLRARDGLQAKYGLALYSPSDFKIEHLANAQQASLAVPLSTDQGTISVSAAKPAQVRLFLNALEERFAEVSTLILKTAGRGVHETLLITESNDICGVFCAYTKGTRHDELDGIFLSAGTSFSNREAAFHHVLECFLRRSQSVKAKAITFYIRAEDFDLERVCIERGFQRAPASPFVGMIALDKIPCPPLVTKSNWAQFRETMFLHTKVDLPILMPSLKSNAASLSAIQASRDGRELSIKLFELETLLAPTLILLAKRSGVVLPITPAFASNLLTRPDDLLPFPLEEEALLRSEKAYFRKPSHANVLVAGTPIVFYESQAGRGVIGCGRITSVKTASCDNAIKLYRRFGVLSSEALASFADKHGNVQIVTFDNFKEFVRPVPLKRLQELGCAKANLVGPEALGPDQLYQIAHEGMQFPTRDVLISIQPDYVAKILSHKKTIELRKKPFPANGGVRVWIYSTGPTSAVEASAFVDAVDQGTPDEIWRRHQHKVGISRKEFDAYFNGAPEAYAISVTRPRRLERKFKLEQIRGLLDGFTPPQYYRYIDHSMPLFDALIAASVRP
jgi:predicted transcriptional regulator/GNAT superfamily N-acetyltransferase